MDEFSQYEIKTPDGTDELSQYEINPSNGINITMNGSPSGIPKTSGIDELAEAIGMKESSGNYGARGPSVNGANAIGKYQIMPATLSDWSKRYLGREISEKEFSSNPKLQDAVAKARISDLKSQGYPDSDIASIWISGKPLSGNNRKDKATGISVQDYVHDVLKFKNPKEAELYRQHPDLWKANEYVKENPYLQFLTNTGKVAGGAGKGLFEGVGKSVASVANLIPGVNINQEDVLGGIGKGVSAIGNVGIGLGNFLNQTNAPYLSSPTSEQLAPTDIYGKVGREAGNIGGEALAGNELYSALGAVPKLGNEASVAMNALRGALSGAAVGQDGFGGRVGGAVTGAAFSPFSQMSDKAISDRIVQDYQRALGEGSSKYTKVLEGVPEDRLAKPVISSFEEPIDFREVRRYMKKKDRINLDKYFRNPTIENAHNAQSDLFKSIKKESNSEVASLMDNARESIKTGLKRALDRNMGGKGEEYSRAADYWKNKVVPFQGPKHKGENLLDVYGENRLFPKTVIDKLIKNDEFRKALGGKYNKDLSRKELLNKLTRKLGPSAIAGAVPGAAVYLGLKDRPQNNYYGDQ